MKPALIIGNGPSVDQIDPECLSAFETFGCNSIFLKFKEWGREVDNVVITDSNRLKEIGANYATFSGKLYIGNQKYPVPPYARTRKLIGRDFTPLRQLTKRHYPRNWLTDRIPVSKYLATTVFDKLRVSFDPQTGFNFGRSVSASMVQLAASLGFKTILLTGIDAHYERPKSYFKGAGEGVHWVNEEFVNNPRMMMEPFFVMMQIALEPLEIKLVDCTPGGRLRFVEKGNLSSFQ